jgi:UDP-galactopyranose mutase
MLTIPQKKKHLLLLNRLMRAELKKDIIPTPSKLSDDEVETYFKRLFVEKEGYWSPIKNKVSLDIDEELFKSLIKQPKMKEIKETKMKPTAEEKATKKEMEKQKEKEAQMKAVESVVNKIYKDLINPYIAKKKAGEIADIEEQALLKKFFQVSDNVRNKIKEGSPKLYDNFLKPKYDEYVMRKDKLLMESKQEMKDIRKSAQEEKRMMKLNKE